MPTFAAPLFSALLTVWEPSACCHLLLLCPFLCFSLLLFNLKAQIFCVCIKTHWALMHPWMRYTNEANVISSQRFLLKGSPLFTDPKTVARLRAGRCRRRPDASHCAFILILVANVNNSLKFFPEQKADFLLKKKKKNTFHSRHCISGQSNYRKSHFPALPFLRFSSFFRQALTKNWKIFSRCSGKWG